MDHSQALALGRHRTATETQAATYEANRALYTTMIDGVFSACPEPSAERTLAVRAAHDFLMRLNLAVALAGDRPAPPTAPPAAEGQPRPETTTGG